MLNSFQHPGWGNAVRVEDWTLKRVQGDVCVGKRAGPEEPIEPPFGNGDDAKGTSGARGLRMKQQIQYCTTSDGVRIAFTATGEGSADRPHLALDDPSPARFRRAGLAPRRARARPPPPPGPLRSARRGHVAARGEGDQLRGLDAAISRPWSTRPAWSASPCSARRKARPRRSPMRARHPDRVSHLILYGGFARGHLKWGLDTGVGPPRPRSLQSADACRVGAARMPHTANGSPRPSCPKARPTSSAGSTGCRS